MKLVTIFCVMTGTTHISALLYSSAASDVNKRRTKAVILKSIKIPPVGGDTCFSNMELAWETLDEKIKKKIKDKKSKKFGMNFATKCLKKLNFKFKVIL